MIGIICLTWIGVQLNAPGWYYGLLFVSGILSSIKFGINMMKIGAEK
jgi:hypothetical protein